MKLAAKYDCIRCRLQEGVQQLMEPQWSRQLPTESSSAGEFHPHALTEPYVIVSHHPALIVQPYGLQPICQCANNTGCREAIAFSQCVVLVLWNLNRRYFLIAHLTRIWLNILRARCSADL